MNNKKAKVFWVCVGIIVLVIVYFPASYLYGFYQWATPDVFRENILVNIPDYDGATHVDAWIESANPYVTWSDFKTDGIVSLPASIIFNTSWNNATLHVTYYQYRVAVGSFDDSEFTQNQFYELETIEYFLDLTELD